MVRLSATKVELFPRDGNGSVIRGPSWGSQGSKLARVLVVRPQQHCGADHRQNPARRMKFSVRRLPDEPGDDAADDRSRYAQAGGQPEAQRVHTRYDGAGDQADDESDDDGSDDAQEAHGFNLSCSSEGAAAKAAIARSGDASIGKGACRRARRKHRLAGTDQASDTVTKGRTCSWPGAHSSSQR